MPQTAAIEKRFDYPAAMLSFFLNPLLLTGLAGIALPVVAHLLSRRKHDIVEWGAMQFLDVSRKTRRKMKLEELLLLLVRILAIALIAFAFARPWINSGFLTGYQSAGSRDVVLVIDGSNSMSRSDGITTLHERAKRRAVEFLATLHPGDTVAIIDARDRPVQAIASPIQNLDEVREALDGIPAAAGAADLQEACEDAVGILSRGSNGNREVVVFTDRQQVGWNPDSDASWKRFDEALNFPAVRPQVWVMDVSHTTRDVVRNIAVGKVELASELTAPGFPVRFEVDLKNTGTEDVQVPISVLLNGQRLANMETRVDVAANSETRFSRSLPLDDIGTKVITIEATLPDDTIPADNSSSAVVQVRSAIPVLLVDASSALRQANRETFYAQIALTATTNQSPWILARSVAAEELTADMVAEVAAVVMADVDEVSLEALTALQTHVAAGKGLFVCLGSNTTPQAFDRLYSKSGFFPDIALDRIVTSSGDPKSPTEISQLRAQWLNRFQTRKNAPLLATQYNRWWRIERLSGESSPESEAAGQTPAEPTAREASADDQPTGEAATAMEIATLNNGDPLLLQGSYGRGATLLMTSSLGPSWNELPRTADYVPFLHEALFQMASNAVTRNVQFGEPLRTVLAKGSLDSQEPGFETPQETFARVNAESSNNEAIFQFRDTFVPGVYDLQKKRDGEVLDSFVVNYDHSENSAEVLTDDDRARLIVGDRLTFVNDFDQLRKAMYEEESRSELWGLLLWVFLGLLVFEVWMTRRMIRQGYADTATT